MNDQIGTYNHEIGENIVRELTDDEQKILNAERKKAIEAKKQAVIEEEKLREIKVSAYQKLGLSDEEIEALLPSKKITVASKLG
jgi:hypothetical protein